MTKLARRIADYARCASGAITIEYVTLAAIAGVVTILFVYEIMGGDTGDAGMAGLVDSLVGELDAAATNIEGAVQNGT